MASAQRDIIGSPHTFEITEIKHDSALNLEHMKVDCTEEHFNSIEECGPRR
jgi:hypothetical protein